MKKISKLYSLILLLGILFYTYIPLYSLPKQQLGGGKCSATCFVAILFDLFGAHYCYCEVTWGPGTVPYCKTGFASAECTCKRMPRNLNIPTDLPNGWEKAGNDLVNYCNSYGSPRMSELGNRIAHVVEAIKNGNRDEFNYWEDMVDLQYDQLQSN
ncbi:MAG: hypothetical protein ACPLKS_07895 [Caldisericum exile]|uniref:hypothetical protein n=1 Tax=Caldisericum exile TaxID=693075 RepID=UPI003C7225DE